MSFSHACSEENFIHSVLELVPTPFVAAAGFGQAWLHSLLVRRESRGPGKVSYVSTGTAVIKTGGLRSQDFLS